MLCCGVQEIHHEDKLYTTKQTGRRCTTCLRGGFLVHHSKSLCICIIHYGINYSTHDPTKRKILGKRDRWKWDYLSEQSFLEMQSSCPDTAGVNHTHICGTCLIYDTPLFYGIIFLHSVFADFNRHNS